MSQQHTVGSHATTISTTDRTTAIKYQNTDVVTFNSDTITLNSDGWLTMTTKLRMNQASNQYNLGYRVHQRAGEWLVDLPDGTRIDYKDNMTITR